MTRFLTIIPGIGLICGGVFAWVNEGHPDVGIQRIMLGVAAIGGGLGIHKTNQAVTADRVATHEVKMAVADLHADVRAASSESIPVYQPPAGASDYRPGQPMRPST